MRRVMVDIETLGVRADAVVLSIAATEFRIDASKPTIGEARVWYPSLREQFALNRTVSEGTLEWWQRDDLAEARLSWAYPRAMDYKAVVDEPVADVYESFAQVVGDADEVWAHGAVFDIGILESLFNGVSRRPPWKSYSVIRDVRTMVQHLPALRFLSVAAVDEPMHIEHDPASDNRKQIWQLWSVWPEENKHDPYPVERPVHHNATALGH